MKAVQARPKAGYGGREPFPVASTEHEATSVKEESMVRKERTSLELVTERKTVDLWSPSADWIALRRGWRRLPKMLLSS